MQKCTFISKIFLYFKLCYKGQARPSLPLARTRLSETQELL
ncbi:hypothetical protein [Moraxella lacunata]